MDINTENLQEHLRNLIIFKDIPDEVIQRIPQVMSRVDYQRNQLLFSEGDDGGWAFLITAGSIQIGRSVTGGSPITLDTLRNGDFYVDQSIISKNKRTHFTRVVSENATVYQLLKGDADRLIVEFPIFQDILDHHVAKHDDVNCIRGLGSVKKQLENIWIFHDLKESELSQLATFFNQETALYEETIFVNGDAGDCAYLIGSGLIRLFQDLPDGQQVAVGTLSSGDFFGEQAIISSDPRSLTATVVSDAAVIHKLTKKDFDNFSTKSTRLKSHFAQIFSEKAVPDYFRIIAELKELLKEIHIFQTLESVDVDRIAGLMCRVQCVNGETIFDTGDVGDSAYIVFTGRIRIYSHVSSQNPVTLATLTRGDWFGERAILKKEPRSASAKVITENAVLYKIFSNDFEKLTDTYPHIHGHFLKNIEETATTNYLRILILGFLRKRLGLLIGAVILLILSITFFPLSLFKKAPDNISEPSLKAQLVATGISLRPEDVSISWMAHGTVVEDQVLTLIGALDGTVIRANARHPGQKMRRGEELFAISTTVIDLELTGLQSKMAELDIHERDLIDELKILKKRLGQTEELQLVTESLLTNSQSLLDIRLKSYQISEQLYHNKRISESAFLGETTALRNVENAMVNAKSKVIETKDRHLQLTQAFNLKSSLLKRLPLDKEQIKSQIDLLMFRRHQSIITTDHDVRVIEAYVHPGQVVTAGTTLAKVRSTEAVRIPVSIPDSYFKWLYRGTLLNTGTFDLESGIAVEISLLNHGFSKVFQGGYIQSIGERVEIPSRSLPIIIRRENPRNEDNQIMSDKELLPGMACSVEISLYVCKNVYVIPRFAFQKENVLYELTPLNESKKHAINIIKPEEILHEISRGMVVQMPSTRDSLFLVGHPLPDIVKGTEVTVKDDDSASSEINRQD